MWEDVWQQVEPAIANLLVVTILAVLGALAILVPLGLKKISDAAIAFFEEKTKIEVEQKWQDDLHRAIESGALAAVEKVKTGLLADTMEAKVQSVIDHTYESVKDAVAGLRPNRNLLVSLALSKLAKIDMGAPAVPNVGSLPR